MMSDPPIPADGACAQCGKERKYAAPSKYAGDAPVHDPFCSADCCRTYYGVIRESSATPVRRDQWQHGTVRGYSTGCRCEPCVTAKSAAGKEAYEQHAAKVRIARAGVAHGTESGYDLGCRCASCTSVHGALEKQAA